MQSASFVHSSFAGNGDGGMASERGNLDGQSTLRVHQWHYGLDARLVDLAGWDVTAEFVQGKQQGSTTGDPATDRMLGIERAACDVAACLRYKGAYVLVDHAVTSWLTPYVRFDWRDAVHRSGADFVYESHTVRSTVGLHMSMTSRIVAKVEYIWNHELGVPDFPHDVLTSSIVVATD